MPVGINSPWEPDMLTVVGRVRGFEPESVKKVS